MKRDSIFLIAFIILVIGLGFSWNELLKIKKENIDRKMENEAMSLKFQRANDYQEIQNVMAAHSYHYEAQAQWEEIQNFWSKRDDIAYGSMHMGRQSVIDYYHGTNESSRKIRLELMSKLYPERVTGQTPAAKRTGNVESGARSPRPRQGKKTYSKSDLNSTQRRVMERYVSGGLMTEQDYIDELVKIGEIG